MASPDRTMLKYTYIKMLLIVKNLSLGFHRKDGYIMIIVQEASARTLNKQWSQVVLSTRKYYAIQICVPNS